MRNSILNSVILLVALLCIGCQQQCQQTTQTAYSSLADTPWRMIKTSDPSIQTLDRFNFRIMQFNRNFTGAVNLVQDNDQYDVPILSFVWARVSTANSSIRLKYSDVTGQAADPTQATGTSPTTPTTTGTYDYTYSLTGNLQLTENQRGYQYQFVPFLGVVDPDSKCSF